MRGIHKLTALQVAKAARKHLTLADGGGLYLQRGAAWVFRYARNGRTRYLGLGALELIDLRAAREAALANRKLLHAGEDPIAHANVQRVAATFNSMVFDDCCAAYVAAHRDGWRNSKHRQQWKNTLATYASPVVGKLPVAAIDTASVLRVLEPIWKAKPETASRLRGRIERVLAWATVKGFRADIPNPARWKNNLEYLLPAKATIRKVAHHAALPYAELPSFMVRLRKVQGVGALALEFAILCAVRTGDIVGSQPDGASPMPWAHVDLDERLWTIPKTKNGSEHRVPLTSAALAVLERVKPLRNNTGLVFPGNGDRALGNQTLLRVLHRMGRRDLTVHGFRATFKTWASERTAYAHEIVEACLTHTISDRLEKAYRRGDFLDKRTRLMAAWADFCNGRARQEATIVALHA